MSASSPVLRQRRADNACSYKKKTMALLPAVIGIQDSSGVPVAAPNADGSRSPIVIELGDGLEGSSQVNGGTTKVRIDAAAGTPASPTTSGTITSAFFQRIANLQVDVHEYNLDLTDIGLALNAAIAALPSTGGVVACRGVIGRLVTQVVQDRPITLLLEGSQITWDTANAWHCSANLDFDGSDRKGTQIISGGSVTGQFFYLTGDFLQSTLGQPQIHIHDAAFVGTSTSKILDVDGLAGSPTWATAPFFNEGLFEFDHCRVSGFTATTAMKFDHSFSFLRIHDNYFSNNQTSLFIGFNCDGHAWNNEIVGGLTGPSVIMAGLDFHITGNILAAASIASQYPDIQVDPVQSTSDGTLWIHDNKFGPENDGLHGRAKIEVKDATPALGINACDIAGNFFLGADPFNIYSITGSGTLATCTLANVASRGHGITVGQTATVYLQSVTDSSSVPIPAYCGRFTVIATTAYAFTFASSSTATAGEPSPGAGCGLAFDAGNAGIRTSNPIERWNVHDNVFGKVAIHVDDVQARSQSLGGGCVYESNTVIDYAPIAMLWRVFRNNGRQFARCAPPYNAAQESFGLTRRSLSTYLENLFKSSEDSSHWIGVGSGVTFTTGQADSLGGTRAILVTRDGTAANQHFTVALDYTGGSTQTDTVYVKFRAKAGTLNEVTVSLFDGNVSAAADKPQTYQLTPATRGELVGTVDLTGVTLSALNGLTFITTIDGVGAGTTTFTTPSSILNIAVQINTTIGSKGTASIVSGRYLRIVSATTGTSSTVLIGAGTADATLGFTNTQTNSGLAAPWQDIVCEFHGVVDPAHNYNVLWYPGGFDTLAGTMTIEFLGASTNNSDYLPTTNSGGAKKDTTSNSRPFMVPQLYGIKAVRFDGATAPTVSAATGGVLSGSSGFDANSSDFAGSLILGTDSTQGNIVAHGTITVAYARAMTGTLPIVMASLATQSMAGSHFWPDGSGIQVQSSSSSGFVLYWWTPSSNMLTASSGYGINYMVIDR
jgi:hypothetical protein